MSFKLSVSSNNEFKNNKFYKSKDIGYEKILNENLEKIKRGNEDEIIRD